jgi:hypothetical protein
VCQFPLNAQSGGCTPTVEPTRITLAEDGNGVITGITWSGWGTNTAIGTWEYVASDFNPNCASATPQDLGPGTVTVSDPVAVGEDQYDYSTMTTTQPPDTNNNGPFTALAQGYGR